jgi:hypothetical protein
MVAAVLGVAGPVGAKPVPGQVSILVRAVGGITTAPDGSRSSTLALSPQIVRLHPLDRLGWKDRDAIDEPHLFVFTTDPSMALGRTIGDGRPCSLCDTAIEEMAAALSSNAAATRIEHGNAGGLDTTGDAYLLRLGDDVWLRVRAPIGTIFYYLDAYHPWQHGEVDVAA